MNFMKKNKLIFLILLIIILVGIGAGYKFFSPYHKGPRVNILRISSNDPAPGNTENKLQDPQHVSAQQIINSQDVTLTQSQKNYIRLVSLYQKMKVERMIAENSQAIEEARLKAAQAQMQLAKMVSKNSTLVKGGTPSSNQYELVYTGKINGHWVATFRESGKLIDVLMGDKLDGAGRVTSITNDTVIVDDGIIKRVITYAGEQDFRHIKIAQVNQVSNQSALTQSLEKAQNAKQKTSKNKTAKKAQNTKTTAIKKSITLEVKPKVSQSNQQSRKSSKEIAILAESTIPSFDKKHFERSEVNKTKNVGAKNPYVKDQNAKNNADVLPNQNKTSSMKTKMNQSSRLKSKSLKTSARQLYSPSEQSILEENPLTYTIQLIGSHSQAKVFDFIFKNQLRRNVQTLQTTRNGKTWYVAIMGQYRTKQEANRILQQFPKSMTIYKPFVRRVRQVQAEILKAKVVA